MSLGAVPDDDEMLVGGMWLRRRQVRAMYSEARPPVAVAWATGMALPGPGLHWAGLGEKATATGLQPFLLSGLDGGTARPWDNGEFSEPQDTGSIDTIDVARLLAGWWWGNIPEEEQDEDLRAMLAPFGRGFPVSRPPPTRSWTWS